MPESIRYKMTRKNRVIDWALFRAIEGLFALYYLYLVEHPELADLLEDLMYRINDCRSDLRYFHVRCWESDPPQFQTINDLPKLILRARKDTSNGGRQCRGYFKALDTLAKESSAKPSKQDDPS